MTFEFDSTDIKQIKPLSIDTKRSIYDRNTTAYVAFINQMCDYCERLGKHVCAYITTYTISAKHPWYVRSKYL